MVQRAALVTGFEPYGDHTVNPAAEVATRLDGIEVEGVPVVGRVFAVNAAEIRDNIRQALTEIEPAVVISVGLAPGTPVIRLERIAINVAEFEIPDIDGRQTRGENIDAAGPAALPATLPLPAIMDALLAAEIPARLSNSAGTYLCNMALYTFLTEIDQRNLDIPCGFIHVPCSPEQVAAMINAGQSGIRSELESRGEIPSMSVDTMVEAVRLALAVSLEATARRP